MDTRSDDISAAMERLTHAIEDGLQDLKEVCGDDKELYLEKAYAVISDFHAEIQSGLGFTDMEQYSVLSRTCDPDLNYEEGDEWGDDDWNDFEEEDRD